MIVSLLGFILGFVVLNNNLGIFNNNIKTPSVDSWLVFVGTLAWSVLLFSDIGNRLSHEELLARVLFFVFWCGQLLKVKRYCLLIKKRKLNRGLK